MGENVIDIELSHVAKCIEDAKDAGKVALFLDRSGNVDTFLQYRHTQTLEAKKCLMDTIKGGKSTEDVLEEMRKSLVAAMKYGKNFHIRMTNSALAVKGKFNSPDCFPLQLFNPAEFLSSKGWEAVLRPEDKQVDAGAPIFGHPEHFNKGCQGEGYHVIVTSTFEVEDYKEFLDDAIPLDHTMVFNISDQD